MVDIPRTRHGEAQRSRMQVARRARLGAACILLVVGAALLGPIIANDEPIACRHEGAWHFPALVEVVQNLPGGSRLIEKSVPFRWPTWNAKRRLSPDEFALWPPVPYGPDEATVAVLQPASARHWLGTDEVGRDLLARLVHGAAISLQVALGGMLLAAVIGTILGAIAGYAGGWTDLALSRFIEVVMCFPVLFLVLGLMVWLEPSAVHLVLVIALTRWTTFARHVRAEFLRQRDGDLVTAARATGAGPIRVMVRHLLPNCLAPVLVALSFGLGSAILIEAGLSWLGFGVPAPQASWGLMLRSAFEHFRTAPHLIYPPAAALFIAVLGFNLLGEAVRDAFDPRRSGQLSRVRKPDARQNGLAVQPADLVR